MVNYWGMPYGYGEFSHINANGNPCDFKYNIFLEPMFGGGGEPFDYHLCWDSPLIDAGNPGLEFLDLDSTVNDIGLYGGPYGETYPYLSVSHPSMPEIPTKFSLSQNYPNPFNGGTVFYYSLPEESDVTITITNVLGQRIKDYSPGCQPAGIYRIHWDGKNAAGNQVSNGIYIYLIKTEKWEESKVMMMVK